MVSRKNDIQSMYIRNLTTGYVKNNAQKIISARLNLTAHRGQLIMLMGPNGCGKSTLMRTIIGEQKPLDGAVLFDDISVKDLSISARSRLISIVLTGNLGSDALRVGEIVEMGRYPYTGFRGKLDEQDVAIVQKALERCGLAKFVDRHLSELSDGEKQRSIIARALAQETPVMLLDEPTAHLDIPNRVSVCAMLRDLAHAEEQKIIVMSTHELDLAKKYADRIWLMDRKGVMHTGTPAELDEQGIFRTVFSAAAIL